MIIKIQNKPILLLDILTLKHSGPEFIFEILMDTKIWYVSNLYGWITGVYAERFKALEYLRTKDKDQINYLFETHNNGIFDVIKL